MPISKHKKEEILGVIDGQLSAAETVVFANFHGLSALETTALRKGLRDKQVSFMVAKKTLLKRALASRGYTGTLPELPGELAIAWGKDQIAPAQSIAEFEKKFDKKISLIGGVFEGEYKDKVAMTVIASIPSRETLLGMFVNVINSPIQGMVVALNAIGEKKSA